MKGNYKEWLLENRTVLEIDTEMSESTTLPHQSNLCVLYQAYCTLSNSWTYHRQNFINVQYVICLLSSNNAFHMKVLAVNLA